MSESCSEFWSAEKGPPKPRRKLRPDDWTGWSESSTEADDAQHEASLQEALAHQSKAVKVVVDKWLVDKGYGFGKAPTGEVVFIHASTVQGVEELTIGTDAWVQVVNDDEHMESKESLGAKRVEGREGQRASEPSGPASEASSGTDCRTCSSV